MGSFRCWLVIAFGCSAVLAQTPIDVTPHIGQIEIFGARKVPVQKIRKALHAEVGDKLPPAEETEQAVNKISGILSTRLEAVCCAAKSEPILYVGVQERDAPHIELHPEPAGEQKLPTALYDNYLSLLENVGASMRSRNADEDLTNGYSLMADPYAREIQRNFVPAMADQLAVADQVLRNSSDPEQRAAAAYLLPYGPHTPRALKVITDALQYAVRDQEDIVRKNAIRSLHIMAIGAKLHPEQEIHIAPTWLAESLNSVVWSDRREATLALVDITENRDPAALDLMRERALDSIVEMARWHDLQHALPAFLLAGRLAGMEEQAIKDAWVREDRETVLKAALKSRHK